MFIICTYNLNDILIQCYLDEEKPTEGLTQVKISKFLQMLLELSNFVRHCEYLLSEIHCQVLNIFEFQLITADIHFQVKTFFSCLVTVSYFLNLI